MQAITRSFPPHALIVTPARLLALRAALGRHDAGPVFEVGCEHTRDGFAPLLLTRCVRRALALACAVEAGQVQTWARDQGGEAGDKVQRFQHHMGSASKANGAVFAQRKKRRSRADQRVPSRKGCL